MTLLRDLLRRFGCDQRGATAIEYVFIASLISIAVIGGATLIGTSLSRNFTSVSAGFNS